MRKRLRYLALCCVMLLCLLPGCQNSEQYHTPNGVDPSISSTEIGNPAVSDVTPSETITPTAEQVTGVAPVVMEELLSRPDIQKIYYGPTGTLLVDTSDTLYWYDLDSGCALAQRPKDDWLAVEYHCVTDGFCAVGTLVPDEDTGGISFGTATTVCIFYDKALQEVRRIILNDLGDGVDYVKCAAVSDHGDIIAYCTMDKLYCYDCVSDTVELVLDLSRDQIEVNKGLSTISSLAFSPSGDKVLFCGSTYSLPIAIGQHSYLTYGCIALDGSSLRNMPFQNFEAGSMTGEAGGYLFFEESMTSASGKIAVVSSSDMKQQVYSLSTTSEGVSGLSCSQDGGYYATVKSEVDRWLIRIYSRETGKLVTTQTIEETGEEYFYRAPAIYALDNLGLCVVKLGGFSDIPSKVITFSL